MSIQSKTPKCTCHNPELHIRLAAMSGETEIDPSRCVSASKDEVIEALAAALEFCAERVEFLDMKDEADEAALDRARRALKMKAALR